MDAKPRQLEMRYINRLIMIDILFKIYFKAFYWEISLLSLGFSCAMHMCVGPEGVLCEVSSNRWSREVKGQLFIDLNT